MVSRALALPVGNLPRNSKERASPKEEPVVPVNHNYHKFILFAVVWAHTRRLFFFFSEITLSTMTFKMVLSAWLTRAVRSNVTESSGASIAIVALTGSLWLSRNIIILKENDFPTPRQTINKQNNPISFYSYTADETGFHPVITEEKALNLRSSSAVHTMYSSDNAELIKITLTEDDAQLARQKSEAALVVTTSNPGPRVQSDSQNSDRQIVTRSESISQPIDQQIARWSRTINPETVVSAVNSQSRFDWKKKRGCEVLFLSARWRVWPILSQATQKKISFASTSLITPALL